MSSPAEIAVHTIEAVLHFILGIIAVINLSASNVFGSVGWFVFLGVLTLFDIIETTVVVIYQAGESKSAYTSRGTVSKSVLYAIWHWIFHVTLWVMLGTFFGTHVGNILTLLDATTTWDTGVMFLLSLAESQWHGILAVIVGGFMLDMILFIQSF